MNTQSKRSNNLRHLSAIILFGLSTVLVANQAVAAPVFLNPGDPCGWDSGCTYLGTDFGANDDLASVESFLGLTGLFSIDKSDNPGQTNFLFNGSSADPDGTYSGTWQYIGPLINPVVIMTIKSGNQYAAYRYDPSRSAGFYSTENLGVGGPNHDQNIPDLSHLSFFGGDPGTEIPEPFTAVLLGAGLLGGGILRKRKIS